MTAGAQQRHALVFGASGLIGRYLILALADSGAKVTAAVRSTRSATSMQRWLSEHGLTTPVNTVTVDFDATEIIANGSAALADVTEIHNCAASFRFGMSAEEARHANVGIVEKLMDFAVGLPELQRVVHISGYRVGGQDPNLVPWSPERRATIYREHGAYEASKEESDAIFQARARELGIPWTIVNPASVIGHSVTGESEQLVGLATTVRQVWDGTLTALPGGQEIFLPVITVDYLASFMAAAAIDPAAAGMSYWLLDDDTPPLADLLTQTGEYLGAKVPRLRIPVSVIKRLPSWITHADPETLTFMSSDRYPTRSALALAAKHGIVMPDVRVSLERWADYVAAHRFSTANESNRRFIDAAGVRTFELGAAGSERLIFPGLPVNADTWATVAEGIGARAVDLPGLGLSGGDGIEDWERWLPAVLGDGPTDLIGHSIGAAAAVLAADRHPARVRSLTLVAPFFLQPSSGVATRLRPLVSMALRHTGAAGLSRRLTGEGRSAAALQSSADDLRRHSAPHVAAYLARAGSASWRDELRETLQRFAGPVRIVTGSTDPVAPEWAAELATRSNVELISIPGAGHHPQLTHGEELTQLFAGARV